MAAIDLDHASVTFPIFDARSRSLKQVIGARVRGRSAPVDTTGERQVIAEANGVAKAGGDVSSGGHGAVLVNALRDVDLHLQHGDKLALIGHNGAGKSTLLRLLAGIYEPTSGAARVQGRVAPVFDLGIGMDPEMTGYENIIVRGMFLGMSRKHMTDHMDEIADFTELGDYLKLPLRSYSTGMRVRVALGVVLTSDPEVLLLDEGLGAVDHSFVEKATKRLEELVDRAGILVFASHSEELMVRLCDRAIRMDGGQVVDSGPTQEVLDRYLGRTPKAKAEPKSEPRAEPKAESTPAEVPAELAQ